MIIRTIVIVLVDDHFQIGLVVFGDAGHGHSHSGDGEICQKICKSGLQENKNNNKHLENSQIWVWDLVFPLQDKLDKVAESDHGRGAK